MSKHRPLTSLQLKFIDNLVSGMNQTEAYIKAGYKLRGKTAEQAASRLARSSKVSAELEKCRDKAIKATTLRAIDIAEELRKIGFDVKERAGDRIKALDILAKWKGMYKDETIIFNMEFIQLVMRLLPDERIAELGELLRANLSSRGLVKDR